MFARGGVWIWSGRLRNRAPRLKLPRGALRLAQSIIESLHKDNTVVYSSGFRLPTLQKQTYFSLCEMGIQVHLQALQQSQTKRSGVNRLGLSHRA